MFDIKLLRYLTQHPLNRKHRFRYIPEILMWSIATRMLPGSQIIVQYVNNALLVVSPGRWGSEANALCGLHEFADMGFLLHCLRPTDMFCDVGANIGAYTVLASSSIGARSLAFEPIQDSFLELKKNVAVNGIESLVDMRRIGLGNTSGKLSFTSRKDTMNHVAATSTNEPCETVDIDTLDHAIFGSIPTIMKLDVEGWEHNVLMGASSVLESPLLIALIVELNGFGSRYGFNDDETHLLIKSYGFSTYRYRPFQRQLVDLEGGHNSSGNTLYIRDHKSVMDRIRSAPPFAIRSLQI